MKKTILQILFFFCFFSFSLSLTAEDNSLEKLLNKNKVTLEDIAIPLAQEIGIYNNGNSVPEAIAALKRNYPKLKSIKENTQLRYRDIALICMQTNKLRGGIMYSFFENKRYAFRELVYLGAIDNNIDPMKKITGQEAYDLFIEVSSL